MMDMQMTDDALPVLLIVLDGLGDRACSDLGGQTPAEYARTPVLDELVRRGVSGVHVPFGPGWATSSERSHWEMFGLSDLAFPGRAVLELIGVGAQVPWGVPMWHLALRAGQTDDQRVWITGRAGRDDSAEAARLGDVLTDLAGAHPYDGIRFELRPLRTAEWVLIADGAESIEVSDTDPLFEHVHPWMQPVPLVEATAAGGTRLLEAERTAAALQRFLIDARQELISQGATFDVPTTKWASRMNAPMSFRDLVGVDGMMFPSSALYRGLAGALEMSSIEVSPTDNDLTMGLTERVLAAGDVLGDDIGFLHVHTKATDEAGHTKDPRFKAAVIEACDAALAPVLDFASRATVMVTGDHATPSVTSLLHSGDPTPLVMCGPDVRPDDTESFGERACRRGDLGQLRARDISPTLYSAARRPFFIGHRPGAYVTAAQPLAVAAMPALFPAHPSPPGA